MATMGQTIRAARMRKGLSSLELSTLVEVTQATISRLENDDYATAPKPRLIAALSKALDVPEWKLLRDAGYPVGPARVAPSDPDPVRTQLLDMLGRVRLVNERPGYLESVLERMLRFDRDAAEAADQIPATRNDNGMA